MELNSDPPEVREAGTYEDELRLVEAMASFDIELRVLSRHVGPRTITYRVMPGPGVTVAAITRRALDVGVQLSTPSCTAREEQGRMFVEVAREDMDIPRLDTLPPPTDPRDILVGVDGLGASVHIRLDNLPHCILAGSSGSGKSTALRVILRGVKRDPTRRLIVCDPKGSGDFEEFHRGRNQVHADLRSANFAIWTAGEILMPRTGQKRASEVSEAATNFGDGNVLLVVDEVQMITSKSAKDMLNRILAAGRSMGMNCILATQQPSAQVLGNEMRANCPTRLVFRVASQSDSRVALGDSGAERLLGLGDGLLRYQGQVTRIQVPSIG